MSDTKRYVAITRDGEKTSKTFVIEGTTTIDGLFKMINDRSSSLAAQLGEWSTFSLSLHLDESSELTRDERMKTNPFSKMVG